MSEAKVVGNPLNFLLAGNATFTLRSTRTGQRFTYKAKKADDKDFWFVSVLTGPDNWENYKFFGTVNAEQWFKFSEKSAKVGQNAPSVKGFMWFWKSLISNTLPEFMEVWHSGKCGRCNRKLTVPESIESGFGPECIGKI